MEQKQRYTLGKPESLEALSNELNEVVERGDYPKSGYQNRKTYVITRDSLKGLSAKFLGYLRRN